MIPAPSFTAEYSYDYVNVITNNVIHNNVIHNNFINNNVINYKIKRLMVS